MSSCVMRQLVWVIAALAASPAVHSAREAQVAGLLCAAKTPCDRRYECGLSNNLEPQKCVRSTSDDFCCVECVDNSDCTKPDKSRCSNFECVACRQASDIGDCLHLTLTPVCGTDDNNAVSCVACGYTVNCPTGYDCNPVLPGGDNANGTENTCKPVNDQYPCFPIKGDPGNNYAPCPNGDVGMSPEKFIVKHDSMNAQFCGYDQTLTPPELRCIGTDCNKDADCEGKVASNRRKCNMHVMRCVECVSEEDCPNGRVCDLSDNTCQECADNLDCTRERASQCSSNHQCKICETSLDCAHIPNKPNCASIVRDNEQLDGHGCVAEYEPGHECFSPLDTCGGGTVCKVVQDGAGTLKCTACASDAECALSHPDRPVCHSSLRRCVECDAGVGKPGACRGYKRVDNKLACTADGECGPCSTNEDCDAGYLCDERVNKCVVCFENEHCKERNDRNGNVCHKSHCIECLQDSDCYPSKENARCDVKTNKCVACVRSYDCRFNSANSQCLPTGCAPCLVSEDCELNQLGDKVCLINQPSKARGEAEAIEANSCQKCVPKYMLSQSMLEDPTQFDQTVVLQFNKGCDKGQICTGAPDFQCTTCKTNVRVGEYEGKACNDPARARCNMDPGIQLCQPCLEDADCKGMKDDRRLIEVCKLDPLNGANRCVECETTRDCYAYPRNRGSACVHNQCQSCGEDADCGFGFVCEEASWITTKKGQCKARLGQECAEMSIPCMAGTSCKPDPISGRHQCKVDLGKACVTSRDCADDNPCFTRPNGDKVCVDCITTADCAKEAKGWGTCTTNNECQPCDIRKNIHCHEGFICDNGICGVCNETRTQRCENTKLPWCYLGACSECSDHQHCANGDDKRLQCLEVAPMKKSCAECSRVHAPCPAGFACRNFKCVVEDKTGQVCVTNEDCVEGRKPICDTVTRKCKKCKAHSECRARRLGSDPESEELLPDKYACNYQTGECVECMDASQCRQVDDQSGEDVWGVCYDQMKKCSPCSGLQVDMQCPAFAPFCDSARGLCKECEMTYSCESGQACFNGRCKPCGEDVPCGKGYICVDRHCVECTANDTSSCKHYGENKNRCNQHNKCVECTKTSDCPLKDKFQSCINNRCTGCEYDEDCNIHYGDQYRCVESRDGTSLCDGENEVEARKNQAANPPGENFQTGMKDAPTCPAGTFICGSGLKADAPPLELRPGGKEGQSQEDVELERAQLCLDMKFVCDGDNHCVSGEDESKQACIGYGDRRNGEEKDDAIRVGMSVAAALVAVVGYF